MNSLTPFKAGSEAAPFLDENQGVVYKLFTASPDGKVGWRLKAERKGGKWRVDREPAEAMDTMEKLALIHQAGGLPTEVLGLSQYYEVVAKQPQAYETKPGMETRANAVAAMNGIQISDPDFHGLRVLWVNGEAWLMGDLHAANIMRDAHGQDRVIDALFMRVPSGMIAENQAVRAAVDLARKKAETVNALFSLLLDKAQAWRRDAFPHEKFPAAGEFLRGQPSPTERVFGSARHRCAPRGRHAKDCRPLQVLLPGSRWSPAVRGPSPSGLGSSCQTSCSAPAVIRATPLEWRGKNAYRPSALDRPSRKTSVLFIARRANFSCRASAILSA